MSLLSATSSAVVCEVRGRVGVVTLQRPEALNALTRSMVRTIDRQLRTWQTDPAIGAVVLQGAPHPSRGAVFCAGADIRFFHAAAVAGDPSLGDFFAEEFRLDHLIWTYPKPIVALLDGIVMGGGMGLVQGARLRVVTEHVAMAMPEVGIGFVPDVGAGHFLSRCPGRVGEYLAVTGATINAADALAFGLADVCVGRAQLGALVGALVEQAIGQGGSVEATVRAHGLPAPPTTTLRADIDRHFHLPTLPAIVRSLAADPGDWAAATLVLLRTRSPLMCAVALEQIRRGRALSLADDLRMELGLAQHAFTAGVGEAVEGIRALAIDKDRRPRWRHASADTVDPAEVDAFFRSPWPADAHPLRDLGATA